MFKDDQGAKVILEHLIRNSRLSYRELARMTGLSPGTVLARVKEMEEKGVIKGYTVVVDHEKLGFELTAITEITVSKGKLLQMEEEVSKIPNTCAVYDVTGVSDAIIIAKFKTREELSRHVKHLLAMPFITRTNTHVVLTTVKEDFRLI